MYSSSAYSKARPSTAKMHRQDARHAAAAAASAWSSAVAFDRRVLSRTVALAQTVSKGVLPEGWPRRHFCVSNAMRGMMRVKLIRVQVRNSSRHSLST